MKNLPEKKRNNEYELDNEDFIDWFLDLYSAPSPDLGHVMHSMGYKDRNVYLGKFKSAFGKPFTQWANETIQDSLKHGESIESIQNDGIFYWDFKLRKKVKGVKIEM